MTTDAENIAAIQKHIDDCRKREKMKAFAIEFVNDREAMSKVKKPKTRHPVDCAIDAICDYLEMRGSDPWDDDHWPQANNVLSLMVSELRDENMRLEIIRDAWGRYHKQNRNQKRGG